MFRINLNEACRLISLHVYEKYKDQISSRDVICVSVVFWSARIIIFECQTLRTQNFGRHLPQAKTSLQLNGLHSHQLRRQNSELSADNMGRCKHLTELHGFGIGPPQPLYLCRKRHIQKTFRGRIKTLYASDRAATVNNLMSGEIKHTSLQSNAWEFFLNHISHLSRYRFSGF